MAVFLTAGAGTRVGAAGQSSSAPPASSSSPADQSAGAPPAATVPAAGPDIENPPLSGLDEPTSEPAFGGRSYLVPGIQLSESVNSTSSGLNSKTSGVDEVRPRPGFARSAEDLEKVPARSGLHCRRHGLPGPHSPGPPGQCLSDPHLAIDQRILWRTGQFAFRDSFSYLPEGSFGFGSFGGAGGSTGRPWEAEVPEDGAGTGSAAASPEVFPAADLWRRSTIGSIGIQPRINNLSVVDVTQSLSPRSTVVVAVAYDYTDFLKNAQSSLSLINSQMSSGQIGYDYLLNRHDRMSATYAYQNFHFPSAGSGQRRSPSVAFSCTAIVFRGG